MDYDTHLSDRLPWVIGFVLILTMLMMAVIFRSVVLAVTTALVNLLSAGAAFGVLTLTFQHTWAQGLLDFRSTGAVITWIPLFTFAVLFGLSMDYHVFIVSRIRERVMAGESNRDAVRAGIAGFGRSRQQRGHRHGVGVRDLRLAAHGRDEGARGDAGRRRADRRAGRPGGRPAVGDDPARPVELVALPSGQVGAGRSANGSPRSPAERPRFGDGYPR